MDVPCLSRWQKPVTLGRFSAIFLVVSVNIINCLLQKYTKTIIPVKMRSHCSSNFQDLSCNVSAFFRAFKTTSKITCIFISQDNTLEFKFFSTVLKISFPSTSAVYSWINLVPRECLCYFQLTTLYRHWNTILVFQSYLIIIFSYGGYVMTLAKWHFCQNDPTFAQIIQPVPHTCWIGWVTCIHI